MGEYLYFFKMMHVIGFVSWFAGLFYLLRMFVYYAEAKEKPEPDRTILMREYGLMQNRVYRIICNPAMMLTWTFGILMVISNPVYFQQGWFHVKLLLLLLLTGFHIYCKKFKEKQQTGLTNMPSFKIRLLNEVPTLFLVLIVALGVYRDSINYLYMLIGLFIFGGLIFMGARKYKKARERNPEL